MMFFLKSVYQRLPLSPRRKHAIALKIKTLWRRLHGRSVPVVPASLPSSEQTYPAFQPQLERQDWLFFSIIDWHFRFQRPQQLAVQVAEAGKRVYYLSPQFIDRPEPGYQLESLSPAGELYQVKLYVAGAAPIYFDAATPEVLAQAQAGLGLLFREQGIYQAVSVVQHAYWTKHALSLPNNTCIYDCMDHHEGFGNVANSLSLLEAQLLKQADWVSVTSDWLFSFAKPHNANIVTIRNACSYTHFAVRPHQVYQDSQGRPVIGYFGAIAEWFDVSLIERLASAFPHCAVVLVGTDTVGAGRQLARYPNVVMLGEQPYQTLPQYLHGFDVCLLPFQVIPLTLATNPVKVYEYLSAGKHVVCVDLPEVSQFGDLVYKAQNHDAFLAAVQAALSTPPSLLQIEQRQAFAKAQNWHQRAEVLLQTAKKTQWPYISVIVLTYNNIDLTRACLDSVLTQTDYPHFELIVVDNASTDGTPEYLKQLAEQHPNIKLILSSTNTGFAAGNNLGLKAAQGDFLVMLNNDTVVTTGWLRTLYRHFQLNPHLGLLGPVTNNIGNEAKVDVTYDELQAMPAAARNHTLAHMGKLFEMRTVAFFCVMLRREVYAQLGGLDENFGRGFFEDDDYCRRIEQAGWSIACADDVFVHHHLSASFGQMLSTERQKLFDTNKAYYESKWGTWVPHRYRN